GRAGVDAGGDAVARVGSGTSIVHRSMEYARRTGPAVPVSTGDSAAQPGVPEGPRSRRRRRALRHFPRGTGPIRSAIEFAPALDVHPASGRANGLGHRAVSYESRTARVFHLPEPSRARALQLPDGAPP